MGLEGRGIGMGGEGRGRKGLGEEMGYKTC